MTRTFKATAIAATVLIGTVSSTFAMEVNAGVKMDLLSQGYSEAVVSQLSSSELSIIAGTMNSGSDSDARQGVRTLIHSFTE